MSMLFRKVHFYLQEIGQALLPLPGETKSTPALASATPAAATATAAPAEAATRTPTEAAPAAAPTAAPEESTPATNTPTAKPRPLSPYPNVNIHLKLNSQLQKST